MKIIFFGSSGYVLPVIEKLKKNYEIELTVTTEKEPENPIIAYCKKNQLPYLSTNNLSNRDTVNKILNTKSEIAVLADFGLIIPEIILCKFKYGILNIHPSLLPKYRGPSPVQNAILNNEKEIGISILRLDNKIDHGLILVQTKKEINENDTAQSLYKQLFQIGTDLLYQNIKQYINNELKLTKQNDKKATFTKLLVKKDGYFDLNNPLPLEKLNLMIRAYFPWPGVWTRSMINGKLSIIKFLPGKKLQVEGKKPINYKDFINGYPNSDNKLLSLLNYFPPKSA